MKLEDIRYMAEGAMKDHGLLQAGWRFRFDRAVLRVGLCDYSNRVISISSALGLVNDLDSIFETILHEIAHALTPGHHHDAVWQAKAREIGGVGSPYFCGAEADLLGRPPVTLVEGSIEVHCPNCGLIGHRHRWPRPLRPGRFLVCRKCKARVSYQRKG